MNYREKKTKSHNDKAVKYEGQYLKASDIFYKKNFIKRTEKIPKSVTTNTMNKITQTVLIVYDIIQIVKKLTVR